MRIKSMQVENYKSFAISPNILLEPEFNIVVGENNTGKTALLEALSTKFQNKPHRNIDTAPYVYSPDVGTSKISLCIEVSGLEIREYVRGRHFLVMYDRKSRASVQVQGAQFISQIKQTFTFNYVYLAESDAPQLSWIDGYGNPNYSREMMTFVSDPNTKDISLPHTNLSGGSPDLSGFLWSTLQNSIYRFSAERLNIGVCNSGAHRILKSDASNLPEVIDNLRSNWALFNDFNRVVTAVLPQIKHVNVRNLGAKLKYEFGRLLI